MTVIETEVMHLYSMTEYCKQLNKKLSLPGSTIFKQTSRLMVVI